MKVELAVAQLEGSLVSNTEFLRSMAIEMRNCYVLSDYIYNKNFNYIMGSDKEPIQTLECIYKSIEELMPALEFDDTNTLLPISMLEVRLLAKNVFLIFAAYSQDETEHFVKNFESFVAQENIDVYMLLKHLMSQLKDLKQRYKTLLSTNE